MKITDIEALPIAVGGDYPFAVIVVLVRTDEGLTGIGEPEARKRPSRDAELPHRYWPDGAVADY